MTIVEYLKILPRAAIRSVRLYAPYYLFRYGYLRDLGWYDSYHKQAVTGAGGVAVPWLNYPIVHFLSGRIRPDMTVFEYGAGNSTVWWASRVKRVISVEHTLKWYEIVKCKIPSNVELLFADHNDAENYAGIAANYARKIDILVIDGRNRIARAKNGLPGLKPDGVIIWDDTERKRYEEGYAYLAGERFRRIDFTGMGPAREQGWTTSIFYRQENCFGI